MDDILLKMMKVISLLNRYWTLTKRPSSIFHVNSGESTKDKYDEVDAILEIIGEFIAKDPDTGIITVKRSDGKL